MKINYTLLFLLVLSFNNAHAQTWLWGDEGISGIKADVFTKTVASNKTGHVYFGGGFQGGLTFGAYTVTGTWIEVYLAKFDSSGNVLWATASQSDSSTNCFSVATDDSDNAYVSGVTGTNTHFGAFTLPETGAFFLVKYKANGSVAWATEADTTLAMGIYKNGFNTTSISAGGSVAVDPLGNEFVTGLGAPLFKFNQNGKLLWHLPQTMHLSHNGFPNAGSCVATDNDGNVYLSGIFTDSIKFGSFQLYSANMGFFIAKFDSSGNALWVHQSTNNPAVGNDFVGGYTNYPIAVDKASGAVYLGVTYSSQVTMGAYTFYQANNIEYNFVIIKYNADGTMAWAKTATPLQGSTYTGGVGAGGWGILSMGTDNDNHIFISGAEGLEDVLTGPLTAAFAFSGDTISISTNNTSDNASFVLKLDSAGNGLCGSGITGGGWENNALGVDKTGKFIYLGGAFFSTLNFGSDNLTAKTGGGSVYLARWKPCFECDAAITTITPPEANVCSGNAALLTASGANTYTWFPATGLNTTTGDSVIANPTTTTTYTIIGTGSCNSDTVQAVVTIIPAPNVPTITVSVTGDSLTSSASSYNQWFFNDKLLTDSTRQVLVIKGHPHGWYYVVVTNPANGCTSTSDSTTSVNQLSAISNQLSVYPNPTNSSVFVKVNSSVANISDWSLQVMDVLGRTLYTLPSLNYSNEIDLSQLAGGVYFVAVSNKTGRDVVKVMKEE